MERKNYPHFFESIQIQKIISAPDARNDVRTKELTKDFFVPLDIYSLLNASIMVDGDVLGFVHCASPGEKNEWSIDEENFIRSISDFIALIISNNNRRKTQETLEKFTDLQQLVAGLASKFIYIPIQKLDEEIEHSLMLLVKNMQMDGAFITYINNETPAKFVVKQRWLGESLQLFENQFINFDPNNHAFEKEKETNDYSLFFYSKWESNKAKREKDFMYKIGVRSGISLSIKDNYGEIIGNLCFLSTLPKILLSNSEISLLSSLTTVLENAFLRKKREEELIRAKVKAEEATLSKSVFLANMSHEIRTPLNAVLGFSEILSRMIKEPTQVDFLNSIRSSGKTLLSLINDILDLSKIEAGKLSIQENEVNLAAIFSEIQNTFIQKTANKGVDFTLSIPADFPKYVILDELRIKQVILNLVSNAVKFTEKGYVNLSLKLKRLGKESVDFELVVKDTGIGVSKGFKKRIFEAFEQQDGQDSRKYGGTGLGLAITHKIITMLGANISLKSEINKGSRFLIKFTDVALADESTLKISKESRLNPERVIFSSPHILVVDDIEENRKLIKGFLLPYAVHLSEAQDGLEAINLMKTNPPDFVFMDLRMPVMDGEEALKVIRANPETEKIPVVALTASAFRTKEKEIECSGFDGYVRKPASLQDIVEIMAKFLPHELKDEKESEKPDSSSITINLSTELYSEIEENVLPLALELHKIRPKKKVIFLAETIIEIGKKYKNEAVENYGQELLRANTNFNVEKERELIMKMEKVFQKA